jgi:hypothetical protein
MQNPHLKAQHIIILTALFVSLFGTLIILDAMNENAIPITGASATGVYDEDRPEPEPEETVIRVVEVEDDQNK